MFVSALAAMLASYPEDVVREVTHPVTGLPSTSQFLPTLAEVKAACEARMKPVYAARKREIEAERRRHLLAPPVVTAEQRERAVKQWFDEIRPSMLPPARVRETRDQAKAKLMDLGGLTPEQFAAIPDAPERSTFQKLKGTPQ